MNADRQLISVTEDDQGEGMMDPVEAADFEDMSSIRKQPLRITDPTLRAVKRKKNKYKLS